MSDADTRVRFHVRVPEGQDAAWRVKHADETVGSVGAFFAAPRGTPAPGADGTYEVWAPVPGSVSTVRQMLTGHEGLIIVREEPLAGGFTGFLATED